MCFCLFVLCVLLTLVKPIRSLIISPAGGLINSGKSLNSLLESIKTFLANIYSTTSFSERNGY